MGGGVVIVNLFLDSHRRASNSFTIKYTAVNPASRTPLSSETEIRCSRLNSASSGLSAAVVWIDPICVRSAAILGLTACCDTTVSPIMSTTHSAAGAAKLESVRVRSTRASRIAIPHTTPIMCIHHNPNPTIAPAWSRLARIRNVPGATTKLRNTSLPSHRLKPRNSIVRRIDTICFLDLAASLKSEPKLLYRSAELLQSRDVAYRVGHQIDRSDDYRNHSPGSKKQILPCEIPEVFLNASLAQVSIETLCLPRHQHSDVAVKCNRRGLPHVAAELALTWRVEIVYGVDGCHLSLRE